MISTILYYPTNLPSKYAHFINLITSLFQTHNNKKQIKLLVVLVWHLLYVPVRTPSEIAKAIIFDKNEILPNINHGYVVLVYPLGASNGYLSNCINYIHSSCRRTTTIFQSIPIIFNQLVQSVLFAQDAGRVGR